MSAPLWLEAQCGLCGQGFIPADDADLTHLEREDGSACGGTGVVLGGWFPTRPSAPRTAPERCEESRAEWCDTHDARWRLEQPHCTAVDPADFWAAQ